MAQYAQDGKTAAGQGTDQDIKGPAVFHWFHPIVPALPALQLEEQQILILHSLYQEISAPDHPPVGMADLADQRVVGALLPDPLHLQDLIRSGGQIGRPGHVPQKLLNLCHGGRVGQDIPALIDQAAGIHHKEPVPFHQEKDCGIPHRAPPHPHSQADGQKGNGQAERQRIHLRRPSHDNSQHRPAAGQQQRQYHNAGDAAQRAQPISALIPGVPRHPDVRDLSLHSLPHLIHAVLPVL